MTHRQQENRAFRQLEDGALRLRETTSYAHDDGQCGERGVRLTSHTQHPTMLVQEKACSVLSAHDRHAHACYG